ncbi:MAG: indolepyruvate ferredoxin oxidoreductase [Betaproteobacteria bacterium RIFCSPLOWO2_02_FULL_68_150]|nr:MAG: indolepyruvate ferredoxin oxidoreductase [Betaproteobacteria bacterium RIFCSPLOWO2_02_FULL_68_150]
MERQFTEEIRSLHLGEGATFRGEGILAVTKALLQSGVAYVGGYQGAPVSHLLDVMVQARGYMDELGVHVEACTNEASAAAMLGASIGYPVRGAVTWKSIVGTNVAADALSYLSTAGVTGGALIVAGEDYGEGASVALERTHAIALKSQLWLLDPRPNLPSIVRMVEKGFELSEASSTPVILDLRIRACHVQGSFLARDNRAPAISMLRKLAAPAAFDYDKLSHPPATFRQEKVKAEVRLPAARRFVAEERLNEHFGGELRDIGIIVQGGLYNNLVRALEAIGLADHFGSARLPILVLNVVYPLVPEEICAFCSGKRAVLVVEEGQPEFIEQDVSTLLRRSDVPARLHGKDLLQMTGEYTVEVMVRGLARFLARHEPSVDAEPGTQWLARADRVRQNASAALGAPVPARPPGFCIGCPERPVFAAIKLAAREVGLPHISADIGCHAFATLEPFSMGNTILGYGMSLASSAAVAPMMQRRPLAIMGDGGFWHNGLLSGVASNLLNAGDAVLVIMKNGYSSATGTQELLSSRAKSDQSIERALAGVGVQWVRTVDNYRVGAVAATLKQAMSTDHKGLKVIIADGECQLERQRRLRPQVAAALAQGRREVRVKYGVDEDTCTGDHSCIRLSGCPTLTVKDNPDPLRSDPVATVIEGCVGCGLCGENADAAVLCPSFYRAEIVQNPNAWDRFLDRIRNAVLPA